jgi:hypothetical protein
MDVQESEVSFKSAGTLIQKRSAFVITEAADADGFTLYEGGSTIQYHFI